MIQIALILCIFFQAAKTQLYLDENGTMFIETAGLPLVLPSTTQLDSEQNIAHKFAQLDTLLSSLHCDWERFKCYCKVHSGSPSLAVLWGNECSPNNITLTTTILDFRVATIISESACYETLNATACSIQN